MRDREKEFSYDSWTSFFSLRASSYAHSWSFRLLGGGRDTPTCTKQRSLLRCSPRGREPCEECNYELCSGKVQVHLTVTVAVGISCSAMPLLWDQPPSRVQNTQPCVLRIK